MINPIENEQTPEPVDAPHQPCAFCPYAIDADEPSIVVSGDRVNGFQVAHVGCAVACPDCHQVVSKLTLVKINPKVTLCGTCARNLIEEATGGWV